LLFFVIVVLTSSNIYRINVLRTIFGDILLGIVKLLKKVKLICRFFNLSAIIAYLYLFRGRENHHFKSKSELFMSKIL